jgi:hypothetical protein
LYVLPDIIRVIKSMRMRWIRPVTRMREMRTSYAILVGKFEEKDHMEDVGVGRRIILQ